MAASTTKSYTVPSTMKAAQQSEYGEPRNVLTLRDNVPIPQQLSSKQVLVQVNSASMNQLDWKLLVGGFSLVQRQSFPHVPGSDVAGVIVDVGSGVTRFKIGDQVYGNVGMGGGAFAEYVRGTESNFSLKPKNLSMEESASLPLACETSYQAVFQKAAPPVGAGSKLFVCGGSSATGMFAIQLAKAAGAKVAVTSSQRNFGLFEKLGYKVVQTKEEFNNNSNPEQLLVIDYNSKDFGQELKGENFDVVFDCVGGQQQWTGAQQILKQGGSFITLVGDDTKADMSLKSMASLGSNLISRKFWSVFSSDHHGYIFHFHAQTPEDLDDMKLNYIETGKVKTIIDTVFDWRKDGVDALYGLFEKSKSGKAQGKLVLKISDAE